MIRLKQYQKSSDISLEDLIVKLESFQSLGVALETHPTFFGLEAIDVKKGFLTIKEVIVATFKAIAEFLSNLWKKLFGRDEEKRLDEVESKVDDAQKIDPEVTEEVSEAIKELVEENQVLSAEPVVPEGLPKQLFTRLVKAHDAFYNHGAMVFQNDVIKDTEYYNQLSAAILDLISTHRVQFDAIVNDDNKSIKDYESAVLSSNAYAEVRALLEKADVGLEGFKYSDALFELNGKATKFKKSPYFVLDVHYNSVYKAKMGELKHGLKVMRETLKKDGPLRQRAQSQESSFNKLSRGLESETQIKKAREVGWHLTALTKAVMTSLRLRRIAFDVNIEFIDAVVSVMQHPTFKKGMKNES